MHRYVDAGWQIYTDNLLLETCCSIMDMPDYLADISTIKFLNTEFKYWLARIMLPLSGLKNARNSRGSGVKSPSLYGAGLKPS